MKIIMIRRDKRVTMELPDRILDIQPEAPRYVLAQIFPMIKAFLTDTAVNQNVPKEKPDAHS